MMKGCLSFSRTFLSLKIGFSFFSRMILFFFMIFMAYSLPVSFFLTRITLENPPLPMTLICSKSFLSTSFFLFATSSDKVFIGTQSYSPCELSEIHRLQLLPVFYHILIKRRLPVILGEPIVQGLSLISGLESHNELLGVLLSGGMRLNPLNYLNSSCSRSLYSSLLCLHFFLFLPNPI